MVLLDTAKDKRKLDKDAPKYTERVNSLTNTQYNTIKKKRQQEASLL